MGQLSECQGCVNTTLKLYLAADPVDSVLLGWQSAEAAGFLKQVAFPRRP